MSFLSRFALVATLAASVAGLIAPISAVQAAELAHVAFAATAMDLTTTEPTPDTSTRLATNTETDPTSARAVSPAVMEAVLQPGDAVAYPSLAAAVAAQTVPADADDQLRCLATSIYFESKGEPLAGQLAVAQVILNRMASKRFGQGVCGVVTQPGQFSFVRGGRVPDVDAGKPAYRTALAVARVALAEAWEEPAPKALYFNARRAPFAGRTRVASIGNHIFYR